jgi:hypothetical protein
MVRERPGSQADPPSFRHLFGQPLPFNDGTVPPVHHTQPHLNSHTRSTPPYFNMDFLMKKAAGAMAGSSNPSHNQNQPSYNSNQYPNSQQGGYGGGGNSQGYQQGGGGGYGGQQQGGGPYGTQQQGGAYGGQQGGGQYGGQQQGQGNGKGDMLDKGIEFLAGKMGKNLYVNRPRPPCFSFRPSWLLGLDLFPCSTICEPKESTGLDQIERWT